MKILIVEDEPDIAELVEIAFRQEKASVVILHKGIPAVEKALAFLPDLIILDLMLPDISGHDVCRAVRAHPKLKHIPVLMLTAKSEEVDRVIGFEIGADDYVTKPFSPRELLLRAKAILKRSQQVQGVEKNQGKPESFGLLHFDPEKYLMSVSGRPVQLTAIEFKLVRYFLANKGRVASRDQLLDKVWGYDVAITTRTVDTHVKRLREKLGKAGDYIETIRGIGYRFCEEPPASHK